LAISSCLLMISPPLGQFSAWSSEYLAQHSGASQYLGN
jgi:hypothetical protein